MADSQIRAVLLASEWGSRRGGLSTFSRELAIQLAKQPKLQVSVLVPRFDQDEKGAAKNNKVALVQATPMAGFEEIDWLSYPPNDLQIDVVIGHGVVIGRHAQTIRLTRQCKWIQFVHTDPEELGMFKDYPDAIPKGEKKHQDEVALCKKADCVVAVGPKLAEAYRSYLRGNDQGVIDLTPGIFSEFSEVVQSNQGGGKCRVLAFGRGDPEDFSLKGFDVAAKAVGDLNDAHLIFVGAQDEHQAKVADRFKECGIPRKRLRVRTFIQIRQQLKSLFSEVDIAIMPSRTEGFGLVALEAMSAGLPVLVSENSGFGEALAKVPFGSHCIVRSEDATVWAEKIKEIWAKDRKTRLREAKHVCQNYSNEYGWEEQCRKLVNEMERILKAPSLKLETKKSDSSKDAGLSMTESHAGFSPPKEPMTSACIDNPDQPESTTVETKVSEKVSGDDLEWLSLEIANSWEALARRLEFTPGEITRFRKDNHECAEKAGSMLFRWKEIKGPGATYRVLCDALSHEFVRRNDLVEQLQQRQRKGIK